MARVNLPTKTKIAAGWIITVGVIGTIVAIALLVYHPYRYDTEWRMLWEIWAFTIPIASLLYLLPGIFLLLRKRWAWIVAMTILSVETVSVLPVSPVPWAYHLLLSPSFFAVFRSENMVLFLIGYFILAFILVLVPFILVILDRKNYWEITRR